MLRRWFLDHPHELGEDYFQHQRAAFAYSAALLSAAAACAVHAIVPALFERTASRMVRALASEMTQRAGSAIASRQRPVASASSGSKQAGGRR